MSYDDVVSNCAAQSPTQLTRPELAIFVLKGAAVNCRSYQPKNVAWVFVPARRAGGGPWSAATTVHVIPRTVSLNIAACSI